MTALLAPARRLWVPPRRPLVRPRRCPVHPWRTARDPRRVPARNSPIMFKDGQVLFLNGKIATSQDCCDCDGEEPTDRYCGCRDVSNPMPDTLLLNLAGVQHNTCVNAGADGIYKINAHGTNGTHTMARVPGSICNWYADIPCEIEHWFAIHGGDMPYCEVEVAPAVFNCAPNYNPFGTTPPADHVIGGLRWEVVASYDVANDRTIWHFAHSSFPIANVVATPECYTGSANFTNAQAVNVTSSAAPCGNIFFYGGGGTLVI